MNKCHAKNDRKNKEDPVAHRETKRNILEGLVAVGSGILRSVDARIPQAMQFFKAQRAKLFWPIMQLARKEFLDIMTEETQKVCLRFLEDIMIDRSAGQHRQSESELRKLFTCELVKPQIADILSAIKESVPGKSSEELQLRNRVDLLRKKIKKLYG